MRRKVTRYWKRTGRCLAAGLLALGLSASLVPGAAAAEDLPDWVGSPVKPTASLQARKELPEKFDLRHCDLDGDGVYENYVTPVKDQAPFGDCWAFGGIAAAETSILSYLGKSWEETKLDLSEKHLAWFAFQPVTEDEAGKDQAGEGLQLVDADGTKLNTNAVYDVGGYPIFVTTLFSSGVGPVREEGFPYRGDKGRTVGDIMESEGKNKNDVENRRAMDEYSAEDDWTIDEKDEAGALNRNVFSGFTLRDGNILLYPTWYDEDSNREYPDKEGMQALKEELMAGHGVNIGFCADDKYITSDTWSHYTYDIKSTDHTVCIVGWDDTYPKENFLADHMPEGDGAWIAKNSWGSEDPNGITELENGSFIGKNGWGVVENGRHTGYFYLSYYDQSIRRYPETVVFTDDMAGVPFYAMQYDYMPAVNGFWGLYRNVPLSSANVYTAEQDMLLTSVSTRTITRGNIVTMSVYLLDQNAKPSEGKQVAKLENVKVPYAGYHRLDLTEPVPIMKGQRFSVVSCVVSATDKDGNPTTYCVSANKCATVSLAKDEKQKLLCTAKVNPGESWIGMNNNWDDWYDVQNKTDYFRQETEGYEVDNFSIKAFGVPFIWDAGRDFDNDAVIASFNSGSSKATAVCAFYDKNGQMLGSSVTEPFTGKLENRSFPTKGLERIDSAKLFLLDEDGSPMCGNETIPWIQINAK